MSAPARIIDALLETTVVGSFSRIGYDTRSRLYGFERPPSMVGRTAVVTGATSGIGYEVARQLLELGATVLVVGRNESRVNHSCGELAAATGNPRVSPVVADLADLSQVRRAADEITRHGALDVLVHNAGTLAATYGVSVDGFETTVACQLLGPFLLTSLLVDTLGRAGPGRVITVSSGGMYAERFSVESLEMRADDYVGVTAYARVKRAQVVLTHAWARRVDPSRVVFHSMHPGWTDTPGVRSALPRFHRTMGPLLRSVQQGADTIVWLAAAEDALTHDGSLWLDRRPRREHKVPWTRPRDPVVDEAELWRWCSTRTGVVPAS